METNKTKPNIILGEVEINDTHGGSWFLMNDSYDLTMQKDGLRGWFTIKTKYPVFKRTEVVTIKPANIQAVVPPALTKTVSCEILDIERSDNGYTYKIFSGK